MRLLLALVAITMFMVAAGCAPAPEAKTPPSGATTPESTTPAEGSSSSSSVAPDTSNLQLVSLKLPGMT